MIKFDNLNDAFTFEANCPQCGKKLKRLFASGKYEDIINFGHKTKLVEAKFYKKSVKLTRQFKIEDKNIKVKYRIDRDTNDVKVTFKPSIDQLIEMFPVVQGFYELDGARYSLAQNSGIINIWNIVNKSEQPFFLVQECEFHYRRVTILPLNEDGDKLDEPTSFDDFLYVPTFKQENQYYVIHNNFSHKTKKKSMFIHISNKEMVDNLDPMKGYVILTEPQDSHLMKLDTSDEQKLSRKLSTICALKG